MNVYNTRDLGAAARQKREALGLTQKVVADAAGMSREWLLSFESGKPEPAKSVHERGTTGAARVDSRDGTANAPTTALVAEVDGHRCGLPVETVVEFHRMVASVPLPEAPPLRGVARRRAWTTFLAKPVTLEGLKQVLERWIGVDETSPRPAAADGLP